MAYYQNTGLPTAAYMVVTPAMSDVSQEDPSEGFGPSKLGVRTTVDEPLSASQAIEVLQAGNRRFVQGDVKAGGLGPDMRRALASHGQRPVATVIGCADCRCPVEQLFDARPGDLFVLRNAGNTMVGSVEYSVAILETKMILVLGHTGCGAIMGATKLFLERSTQKYIEMTCRKDAQESTDQSTEASESEQPPQPGCCKKKSTLLGLLDALVPVAEQAGVELEGGSTEEIAAHAVKVNVWRTINFLLGYSLIIREKVTSGEVELQGAVYNMSSGAVEFLGKSPKQAQLLNYDGHVVPSMGGLARQAAQAASVFHFFECCAVQRVVLSQDGIGQDIKWPQMRRRTKKPPVPPPQLSHFFPAMAYSQNTGLPTAASMVVTPAMSDVSQEYPSEGFGPSKLGVRTTVDEPLSASQAIEVLQAGNRRFVQGDVKAGGLGPDMRRALASHGQRPVATVIGCADSRCPVEQLFDARPGDLFVLRNAGNTCTHAEGSMVGSVEYSVAILETKMILVLGHTGCGAIMGATKLFLERSTQKYIEMTCRKDAQESTDQSTEASESKQLPQPGCCKKKSTLLGLLDALVPVAEQACVELEGGSTEEIAAHAVKVNVWRTINFLLSYSLIIREKVASGEVELQGAVYNMSSGAVEFLGKSPKQAQLLNYDGHVVPSMGGLARQAAGAASVFHFFECCAVQRVVLSQDGIGQDIKWPQMRRRTFGRASSPSASAFPFFPAMAYSQNTGLPTAASMVVTPAMSDASQEDPSEGFGPSRLGVRTTVDEPLSASQAIEVLQAGNRRFVQGDVKAGGLGPDMRRALASHGQRPVATVIGCADSRCPVEQLFDARPGDLFVLRNAGNTCTHAEGSMVGSVEYSVAILETKMILVLGHTGCGAIMGATKLFLERSTQKYIEMTCRKDAQESTDQSTEASESAQPPQPGCCKKKSTLLGLLDALVPVAEQACVELEGGSTEEIAAHAVKVNVWRTINFLLSYSLIIREQVASGEVELQGAVYNMSSGAVEFLGKSPKQEKLLNHDGHVVPSMGGLARQAAQAASVFHFFRMLCHAKGRAEPGRYWSGHQVAADEKEASSPSASAFPFFPAMAYSQNTGLPTAASMVVTPAMSDASQEDPRLVGLAQTCAAPSLPMVSALSPRSSVAQTAAAQWSSSSMPGPETSSCCAMLATRVPHAEGSMVGSVEYSVAILETKMILVLGHTGCGAIMGATKLFLERSTQKYIEMTCRKDAQESTDQSTEASESEQPPQPGCCKKKSTLLGLLDALVPVAEQACVELEGGSTEEIAAHAVKVNVWRTINFLLSYSLIIREKVASGEVELQGAVYNMNSGAVEFLGKSPKQEKLLNHDGHVVPSMGGLARQAAQAASVFHFFECCAVQRVVLSQDGIGQDIKWPQMRRRTFGRASSPSASAFPFSPAMAYYQNTGLPTAASMVVTPAMSDVSQEDPSEGFGPSKLGVRTTVDEPLSASQAIEVLQAGNRRFVQGDVKAGGLGPDMRRALASHGQRPVATVIGCADSRCPVEQLFDARPGDLFVLRNAGNTCTHAEGSMVGSVEYSVAILETKMILVLGHTGCGAIMGATKLFLERSTQKYIEMTCRKDAQESTDQSTEASESAQPPQPGCCKKKSTLLGLLDALVPVAEQACVELEGGSTEEIAAHAVKVNVWRTINFLLSYSLIIREKVASGEVELQGAVYNMSSGAVEFLGKSPKQEKLLNYDGHVVPSMGGLARQAAQAASVFHFFECCAVQRVVLSQDGTGQEIKWPQMRRRPPVPPPQLSHFSPAMAYYQNTGLPTAASMVVTPAMSDASQEDPSEGFGPSRLGVRTTVDEPLSASQAIEVLQAGNRRFVQGDVKAGGLGPDMRRALASHGQRPVATVIGCADSRCPVEQLFDARPGDLFVLRNAGNTCTHAEGSMVGSVEYSVAILETKMILVLGHTGCGAIMGATKLFLERSTQKYIEMTCRKDAQESTDQSTEASESAQPPQPGCCKKKSTLLGLLDALVPVAEQACVELEGGSTEEIAAHAVKVNVWRTINFLLSYSLIIREKVASGEVELQGAVYNMSSGAVEFLGKSPKQEKLLNHDGHVVPSMGGLARQAAQAASVFHFFECQDGIGQDIKWPQMRRRRVAVTRQHDLCPTALQASSPSASAFPFFPAMAYYQNTGLPTAASMVVTPAMSDVSQEDPSEGFGPSKLGVRTTVDEPLSASQAIEVLQAGNRRFVQGDVKAGGLGPDMRRALASHGQRPVATVIGCADSRCPVEQLFDARPGDLFVLRNAGNTCTHAEGSMVGSVEYSVAILETKMILVLGHTGCGAIMGATKLFLERSTQKYIEMTCRKDAQESTDQSTEDSESAQPPQPGCCKKKSTLLGLLDALVPVAEQACVELEGGSTEEIAAHAVKVNVWRTINFLLSYSLIIREKVASGEVELQGAVYNMNSGAVEFLGKSPKQEKLLNHDGHVVPSMGGLARQDGTGQEIKWPQMKEDIWEDFTR
ncbi:unnamed protein product [Polarella glacialis]|uniref:carbonic anhydrase n=1 Tax=Polarella glacialis TaxID=89957 RepID=A0A813HEM4_POLGL|nr:unnamed protein product [Polarella glacialis]